MAAPHADQLRLYVKEGSAAEKLEATFDYTDTYFYSYDSAAVLTLRLEGLLNTAAEELESNPRARSAKLRIAEKV